MKALYIVAIAFLLSCISVAKAEMTEATLVAAESEIIYFSDDITLSDLAAFSIDIDITAEKDIYIPTDAEKAIDWYIQLSQWAKLNDETCLNSTATVIGDYYLVKAGKTERFTFMAVVKSYETTLARLCIIGIEWSDSPIDPTDREQELSYFRKLMKTDYVFINKRSIAAAR